VTPLQALDLDRDSARDLVREELSRREYDAAQPPSLLRLIGRGLRRIGELLDSSAGAVPGGRWGQLLLLLLLLGLIAVVLTRVGPLASREPARAALFEGSEILSAAQHRSLAEQAAAEQRWADAVRERLRAVVRDLEARGVLDPRPGRTAGEVARDAGAAVPAVADELRRAAVLFDEIWYGGRTADASSYAALVAVDEHVREARMVLA
jgi:hypothetical protein